MTSPLKIEIIGLGALFVYSRKSKVENRMFDEIIIHYALLN